MRSPARRLAGALALLLLASPLTRAQACTTTWTNATGGAWNDAANWSGAAIPGPTDDACVTLDGTYTVTHTAGNAIAVNSLTLGAASGTQTLSTTRGIAIGAASTVAATGVVQWSDGRLTGGATLTNNGLIILDGDPASITRGVFGLGSTLANAGSIVWQADYFTLLDDGAMLNSGTISVEHDGVGTMPILSRFGSNTGSRLFTNTGTVSGQVGTLSLNADSRHVGATFEVAAGATVELSGAVHTFGGMTTGAPVGDLVVAAEIAAEPGATWNVGGSGLQWRNGLLTGGETLTNVGTVVLNGDPASITRGVRGLGSTLSNVGSIVWQTDYVTLYDDGALTNSGTISVEHDGVGALPILGRFGDDTGSRLFTNTGTITGQVGTLSVDVNSRHVGATFEVAAGATILFNSAVHTFAGTTTGAPVGDLVVAAEIAAEPGATWNVGGSGLQWRNGLLTGGETLTNVGTVVLNGDPASITRGVRGLGSTLSNVGSIVWQTDYVTLYDDGALTNSGTVSVEYDGIGALPVLSTFGSNSGARTFTNTGTVEIDAASTLLMNAVFDHQTGAVLRGAGTLDFGTAPLTHDGDTAPGTDAATGVLTWMDKPWAPPSSATLFIDLAGPTAGTSHDQLAVTGAAALAGTLALDVRPGFAPSAGQSFTILTASSVTGAFDTVTAPPGFVLSVVTTATEVVVTVDAVGSTATLTGDEGWRMLAPAVSGQTLDGVVAPIWTQGFPGADFAGGDVNVLFYDETVPGERDLGFTVPGNQSDDFPLGTGAFVYVYSDDDFDGVPEGFPKTLTQSGADVAGPFTFPVSYTSSGLPDHDGWNLAGNPFAATMDWDAAGWTKTNVDASFYIWDPATAQYRSWNGMAGTLANGLVAPAQGFWVHATGAPTLEAPAAARTTGGAFVGRPASALAFRLDAAFGDVARANDAVVAIAPDGSPGRDRFDAFELDAIATPALLLATGDPDQTLLDIQVVPEAPVTLPLHVGATGGGGAVEAHLSWDGVEGLPGSWPLTLVDLETGTTLDLRTAGAYTFQLTPDPLGVAASPLTPAVAARAGGAARFELRLGQAVASDPTGDVPTQFGIAAAGPNPFNRATAVTLSVPAAGAVRVEVIDALGRQVAVLLDGEVAAGVHRLPLAGVTLPSGVYTVRARSAAASRSVRLTRVR